MNHSAIWQAHCETGFLLQKPLHHLGDIASPLTSESIETLESIAQNLPDYVVSDLANLPLYDFTTCRDNEAILERLWLLYGYMANKFLHTQTVKHLPEAIAKPLAQVSDWLDRPPIMSYIGMVLSNWRKHDVDAPFSPQNVDVLVRFTHLPDEAGFFRVHIAIEAQAGAILQALWDAQTAITMENNSGVLEALRNLRTGLVTITSTFHEMPDFCDSDVYFHHVRPYLFGYDGVIFDGVSDSPRYLRGGSGAQSSVIPAVLGGMGLAHTQTQLTSYLAEIRSYMPQAHRQTIDDLSVIPLRAYCAERPPLRDAYNHALRQLTTFRRAHLYYARTYIFEKSMSTTGTGGTDYLSFLTQLIDETAEQRL